MVGEGLVVLLGTQGRPALKLGGGPTERKEDVISDSVSFQGPVLGNRNQRIAGEGVWEPGRKRRIPGSGGSWEKAPRQRQAQGKATLRSTFLQYILRSTASFKRKNCSVPWVRLLSVKTPLTDCLD